MPGVSRLGLGLGVLVCRSQHPQRGRRRKKKIVASMGWRSLKLGSWDRVLTSESVGPLLGCGTRIGFVVTSLSSMSMSGLMSLVSLHVVVIAGALQTAPSPGKPGGELDIKQVVPVTLE